MRYFTCTNNNLELPYLVCDRRKEGKSFEDQKIAAFNDGMAAINYCKQLNDKDAALKEVDNLKAA